MRDPGEVERELARQGARTATRSELAHRHPALPTVSPRVGVLDEAALSSYLRAEPDAALSLLADLARATDAEVRAAARLLARDLALRPPPSDDERRSGRARLVPLADPDAGDVDLDATLGRLDQTPRLRREDLRVRGWRRRGVAYVVLVDVSGSAAMVPTVP